MPLFGPCVARQREGRCAFETKTIITTLARKIDGGQPGERKFSVYLDEEYGWREISRFEMTDLGKYFLVEKVINGVRLIIEIFSREVL